MSGDDTIRRNMQDNPAEEDFSEDQFYEEGEAAGQDAGDFESEEDWESYDPEFSGDGEETDGKPAKKKMSMFNIIVIGGAVVLGLGVMYMKMGGSPPPPAQNTQTAQTETPAPQPPAGNAPAGPITTAVSPETPDQQVKKPGGFLNDQAALSQLPAAIDNANQAAAEAGQPMAATTADQADQPPMPAPISATEQAPAPAAPGDELTPLPPPAQMAETPAAPAAPSSTDAAAGVPEQTDALPPAMPQAAQSSDPFAEGISGTGTAAPAPGIPAAPTKSAAIPDASTMTTISSSLNQIMQRMDALEMKLSKLQTNTQGGQDLQPLRNSLNQIEDRLSALEKNGAAPAKPGMDAPAEDVSEQPAVKKAPSQAPRAKAASVKKAAPKQSSEWVLKSAQPGQAYVSRPGQDDLLSVHVGDKLSGIGTVQSIAVQGGRWVISGTSGSVTQ